ncbi:MAG TPA: MFS transporter, partial [Candidatus Limnocylindria bacterium]|nr:MFS transporter [Candidatus Limnocylindria bacterium]
LFVRLRELPRPGRFDLRETAASWAELAGTVREARRHPGLLRFIVARFFYSDPINTAIVVMAAFAVHAIGFTEGVALQVLLLLTVVAVLASFGWGALADRWGPRRTLLVVLGTWVVGLIVVASVPEPIPFLVAGALLGAGLGGVGVTDRLLLLRLAPADRVGAMLGLYGLVGKFSAVVGPFLYGTIVEALLPGMGRVAYQWAIASLLVLMLVGIVIVRRVPEGRPIRDGELTAATAGLEPAIVPPAGGPR